MKKMLKKWEGGAKKHGGLGNSMVAQVEKWVEPIAEQVEKMDGGAEKHGGLDKAALAQVHTWTAPSSSSSSQDESALRREAEELVARREAEEVVRREAEEVARREAIEEVAAKKQAEKPTFKKFMLDFLRKADGLDDDIAVPAMSKLHAAGEEESNANLAQMLFSLKDPVINKEVISWFMPAASEGVVAAMGEGVVGDDVADEF